MYAIFRHAVKTKPPKLYCIFRAPIGEPFEGLSVFSLQVNRTGPNTYINGRFRQIQFDGLRDNLHCDPLI